MPGRHHRSVAWDSCERLILSGDPDPYGDPASGSRRARQGRVTLANRTIIEAFAASPKQGLDWPDPAPDGTKFAGSDIKTDKESAEFQAAYEVCDDELAVEDESGAGT